jgi:uncharacterized protein YigE (DUF2233 family)
MKRQLLLIFALLFLIPASANSTLKAAYVWIHLADGLAYTTYSFAVGEKNRTAIHAFVVDPKKYRFDVLLAENEREGSTVRALAQQAKASLAVNGGFFTPQHTSIGLIIKDGRRIRRLHRTSWWSVFAIKGDGAHIYSPRQFSHTKDVRMALQVGPRLVINGKIPRLKDGVATRSALGITKEGRVVIAITSGYGLSLRELARRMNVSRWEGGLECTNAMALDGGSSSQLYAHIGEFKLDLPGGIKITNSIGIFPK